ncbi:hypothetical protein UlMin_024155 [Ulmus minor]
MVRRKANRIDHLKLDNGDWISSRGQVGNLFVAHFEATFDTPNQSVSCDLSELVSLVITDEENYEMLKIPTWDEVQDILANRLKLILNHLIYPTKSAFVLGRSIRDNSVLVQEVFHSMKKKKDAHGWMGLKIHMDKAYDRLS